MPKRNLKNLVADLKTQKEAFDQQLIDDLSDLFGLQVSGVEDYQQSGQTETGILVSGSNRYRFRIDGAAGVKELS